MSKSKRRRGRPVEIDRDAALAAIVEVFRHKGYDAASLDELSEAANLSRPSLYRSFGNKLSMYICAMQAFGSDASKEAVSALSGAVDLKSALAGFYEAMLEKYYEHEAAPGCLVFGTAPSSVHNTEIKEHLKFNLDGLERHLRRRVEKDGLTKNADRITAAVELAANTLIAMSLRAKAGVDKPTLIDMGRRAADTIVSSLRDVDGAE